MPGFPEGTVDLPVIDGAIPTPDLGGAPSDDLGTLTHGTAPAISPTAQQSFGNVLAYGLPGLGVGLLDTLGQSVGVFKDSTVPNTLKSLTGEGEGSFGDFYSRNQQPLRTGGELAGMFLPGLAAMKILKTVKLAREAGALGEVLQSSRALDVLLGNSAEISGLEAKIAQETVTGSAAQGVWAGRTIAIPAVTAAKRGYYAARALDAARTTVAFELGNRVAFNSSDTFYPADYTLTDQLKWAGIGLAGGVALDLVSAKYAVRQLVQGALRTSGAADVLSPTVNNIASTIFRPADRGVGITQFATLQADLKQTTALSTNATLQTNLTQDFTNIKGVLANQIKAMAFDTHPVLPRTSLSDPQIKLALTALDQNPTTFLWSKKLSDIPENATDFYTDLSKTLDKARSRFAVDSSDIVAKGDPVAIAAASATLKPIENAANEIHYVIENDGRYTIYKNRADNYLDQNGFNTIKRQAYSTPTLDPNGQNTTLRNSKLIGKAANTITLHDNFRAEIPDGAKPEDYSLLYAMGSKLINEWKPVENQQFILTPALNWRTTEMTLALADAKPEAAPLIKLGGSVPPPQAGFTRVFHGGENPTSGGSRFITRNMQYAANYRGPNTPLHYADIPNNHPAFIENEFHGDLPNGIAPLSNMEVPEDIAKRLQPYPASTGFSSIDDARFHVLDQKFREFQILMNVTERKPMTGLLGRLAQRVGATETYTPAQVLQRLNLPENLGFQPSPLIETFAHARLQNMRSLYDMFPVTRTSLLPADYTQMDLLQAHLRETLGITDPKKVIPTSGVLLKQQDIRPLFVAATSTPMLSHSDGMIAGLVQAKRDVQLERLAGISPEQSPLIAGILNQILTKGAEGGELSGVANDARAVQTLQDGLASGHGQIVYQERINEQFSTLKAMQLLAQSNDSLSNVYISNLMKQKLSPQLASVLAYKGLDDLRDFNRIEQSYRHGWDIAGIEASPTGDGVVFRLNENSDLNKKLMARHFNGQDIDEGAAQYMPDMSVTALKYGYKPLVTSKISGNLASSISELSRQSGIENNSLRVALGSNPTKIRDFHLPTPELSQEGAWFVRNSAGDVIATYASPSETANRARALEDASRLGSNSGEIHVAVPLSTVQRDHAIFDENFFDVIDYSDQIKKSGASISGGLVHTAIDTGPTTIKSMVRSLQRQYLNIGIRARAAVFEPELNYARQAANVNAGDRNNVGGFNIFDRYVATAFSQNIAASSGQVSGLYGKIEGGLDRSLSWLNAHYTELTGSETAQTAAKTMKSLLRKQSSEAEFRQFNDKLPEWNPFYDANTWAESTFHEKMPWTTRPLMGKLAQTSSTLALRFLDEGMTLTNLVGLVTNLPSVTYALRQLPGEARDVWLSRTAAWSSEISDGIATFSPMKAMSTAARAYWTDPKISAAIADATKKGYTNFRPEYTNLHDILSEPLQGPSAKLFDKFVKTASLGADKSESWSRKFAWAMGYKIGMDLHGFDDERNAYIYANNFVNETIGNYSPNNKPAMFSGAIGMPLGAFQTYMFNFYRRLYGLVERGDKAALIAQYAAQASMFGARSVPGYGAWNAYMTSNAATGDDFQGRVQRNFSGLANDLVMNGSLSNIPRIFGTNNGLALYSRGSVDFTNIPPTILDWQKAPPIQFLYATAQGISATINNIFSNEHFSLQQQEEILARFTTNRALKSIMEMAANARTDKVGESIQTGTRDAIHVAAALLGTQPTYTRSLQDAYNRDQSVQRTQEDLRATLNDKTRAMFRGGEFDMTDLQGVVEDYRRSGGNVAYLGQWLRQTFTTAMTPKAYTRLEELGRSGKLLEFENMLAAIQQNQDPQK